jgi:hypothetical protein
MTLKNWNLFSKMQENYIKSQLIKEFLLEKFFMELIWNRVIEKKNLQLLILKRIDQKMLWRKSLVWINEMHSPSRYEFLEWEAAKRNPTAKRNRPALLLKGSLFLSSLMIQGYQLIRKASEIGEPFFWILKNLIFKSFFCNKCSENSFQRD